MKIMNVLLSAVLTAILVAGGIALMVIVGYGLGSLIGDVLNKIWK